MTQYARPSSDISTSNWTTTPLYQKIDEASYDDGDYIQSTGGSGTYTCEVKLSSVTDPQTGDSHVVKWRGIKAGPGSNTVQTRLYIYQGTTLIATSGQYSEGTSFAEHSYTLTSGEANNITDYTDIRFRIEAVISGSGNQYARVSWAELGVPDAGTDTTDTAPAWMRGKILTTSTKSAWLKGKISLTTEAEAWLKGSIDAATTKSAWLKGGVAAVSTKSAWMTGAATEIPVTSTKPAWLLGTDAIPTAKTYPDATTFDEAVAPYDDNGWTNHDNVAANDGVYATITSPTFDDGDYSFRIVAQGFGFSIPTNAVINGIYVEVERRYANGTVEDALVALYNPLTTTESENKAAIGVTWPTTDTVKTYGAYDDLWNISWTPEAINSANFAVRFACKSTGTDSDAYVDFIRVTVWYKPGTGVTSTASAWLSGRASGITTKSAWMAGGGSSVSTKSAWLQGANAGVSTKPAWLKGANSGVTTAQAWMQGGGSELVSTKSAWMIGIENLLSPDQDIADVGTWENQGGSPSNLYQSIDEKPGKNDSDYIHNTDVQDGDYYECALENPAGTPGAGDVVVFWRAKDNTGSGHVQATAQLRQGSSTVIASMQKVLTATLATYYLQLTPTERGNITDWNDLRLRIIVNII